MRPVIPWPDGKKICATFTVAFEAFTHGGHFKKAKGHEVNLVSISHANYGGNAGIWRILDILQRNDVRATIDVNGLAVQKWPEAIKALHDAGSEIAGHGMVVLGPLLICSWRVSHGNPPIDNSASRAAALRTAVGPGAH
jgi:hypothetical protein